MSTNRREAIGAIGAAVAATALAGSTAANAQASRNLGSKQKTMFWVASTTPCDKNLKVDLGAMKAQVQWFKHQGADGIVVLGTTGEYPSFSVAERKAVMDVVGKNKDGMNIILSPGTPNFPETIELSKHAADHGADGLLVIPPFYFKKPETAGLIKYYSLLFDAVPQSLAVNLYHIPGTSAVPITTELLNGLKHYSNLAGIKDSNNDMPEYVEFVKNFPELNMRTGIGGNGRLEYALDHGMGAILADGNLFTKQYAEVFAAFRAGQDYKTPLGKLRDQEKLLRDGDVNSYGPMKYALSLQMGSRQTYQRPPFLDVTEEQKAAIQRGLAQIKEMG
ncbi:MAG TPA: dihydrodipicolinate synthase family protein [Rhizomicrobium sp.]|jgi:4-hydroxy-tetrahydrodipicolinate synthase